MGTGKMPEVGLEAALETRRSHLAYGVPRRRNAVATLPDSGRNG